MMSASRTNAQPIEFMVVLGGDLEVSGVYENQRPTGVAVGKHKHLVPIVVTCKKQEDAEAVNLLNQEVFAHIEPDDYEGLMYSFKNQLTPRQTLTKYKKFHAIVYGWETGIWVNWDWVKLEHFVEGFKFPKYKAFTTMQEALVYMIEKEPYMSQALLPPPPSKKIVPGIQASPPISPSFAAPGTISTSTPFPSISSSGLFGPKSPPQGEWERRSVPTVRFAEQSPPSRGPKSPSRSRSASPGKAQSRSTLPTKLPDIPNEFQQSRFPLPATLPNNLPEIPNEFQQSRFGPLLPLNNRAPQQDSSTAARTSSSQLAQWVLRSLPEETRPLRAIFQPLPSQSGSPGPALTFGMHADTLLHRRHTNDDELLILLRARLYSINCGAFAFTLQEELGWSEDDAAALWDAIELPSL